MKVPLGLTQAPPVPAENPMTVAKWVLGKKLYFDTILSTDGTVACATCHDPKKGFADQRPVSTGINGAARAAINSPDGVQRRVQPVPVLGRPGDVAGGPGAGAGRQQHGDVRRRRPTPGRRRSRRLRASPEYVKAFERCSATPPTRDAAAKAIATYERTVLLGNALHDRAEAGDAQARERGGERQVRRSRPKDYATVLEGRRSRAKDTPR